MPPEPGVELSSVCRRGLLSDRTTLPPSRTTKPKRFEWSNRAETS